MIKFKCLNSNCGKERTVKLENGKAVVTLKCPSCDSPLLIANTDVELKCGFCGKTKIMRASEPMNIYNDTCNLARSSGQPYTWEISQLIRFKKPIPNTPVSTKPKETK